MIKFLSKKSRVQLGPNEGPDDFKRSPYLVTDDEIANYSIEDNMNIKVMHFTHTDIAGKVCSLLASRTFRNIDTQYCSNNSVDDIINTFALLEQKHVDYDLILVSDVSLSKGTLFTLDKIQELTEGKTKVRYYNHQECNLDYNSYPWVTIEPEYEGIMQDSSSILYRHLSEDFLLPKDEWLDSIVESSRRYTRWEWKDLGDDVSNGLSMLCHDSGDSYFVKRLIKKHIATSDLLDEEDLAKLEYLEENYQEYKQDKINEVILWKVDKYKTGFVFADRYINRLGSDLSNHYKHLDAIIIINSLTKLNVRTADGKNVDVSDIAKTFGGNGEKAAAGAPIPVDIREQIIKYFVHLSNEKCKIY